MTLAQNVPRILPAYSILPDLCPRACTYPAIRTLTSFQIDRCDTRLLCYTRLLPRVLTSRTPTALTCRLKNNKKGKEFFSDIKFHPPSRRFVLIP